jgi:hypothetical protein
VTKRVLLRSLSACGLLLVPALASLCLAAPAPAAPKAAAKPAAPHAAVKAAPPGGQRPPCARDGTALREVLEPVVEASIDGHPDLAGPACDKALAWWAKNGKAFGRQARADSLLRAMAAAGKGGKPLVAARLAVVVATSSYRWCKGTTRLTDRMMRLDLVGMSAWLRAHGENAPWPAGTRKATAVVAAKLVAKKRADLADNLKAAVTAAHATPVAKDGAGDAGPAKKLLDLVDVVEKTLK